MSTRSGRTSNKGSTARSLSNSQIEANGVAEKTSSSSTKTKSKSLKSSAKRSGSTPAAPASRVSDIETAPSRDVRVYKRKIVQRVGTKPTQLYASNHASKGARQKGKPSATSRQRVSFKQYTGPALSRNGTPMGVPAMGRGRKGPNGPGGDGARARVGNDRNRSPSPARSTTPVPSSPRNDDSWQDNVSFDVSEAEMDSLDVDPLQNTAELREELSQKQKDMARLQKKKDNSARIQALKLQIAEKDQAIADLQALGNEVADTQEAAGSTNHNDTPSWVDHADLQLASALLDQPATTPRPRAHSTPAASAATPKAKRKAPWHELPEPKRPRAAINELSPAVSEDSLGESSSSSSDSTSSDSSHKKRRRKRKLKSGMFAKYSSKIVKPQKWPHNHLDPHFINPLPKFADISWDQLVAGELAVILSCSKHQQVLGRLKLLKQLAYWKIRTGDFPKVRQLYMGVLNAIEQGESSWSSNFQLLEMMIMGDATKTIPRKTGEKSQSQPTASQSGKDKDRVFFCKKYQVGECEETLKDHAHRGWLGNSTRLLHHVCAACLLKKRRKEFHREKSDECPLSSA